MMHHNPIHVIGGGLAGSEAAWQIAGAGVPVVLHEMRPLSAPRPTRPRLWPSWSAPTPSAPTTPRATPWACCTRRCAALGSLIMAAADAPQAAGRRRARRRPRRFLGSSRPALAAHPLITIERGEVAGLPPADWDSVIVATGPLTSPALSAAIRQLTGEGELAFFDAIAPIVHREFDRHDLAWRQSRYDKAGPGGTGADYINCPMTASEYEAFIDALLAGEKTEFKEWEASTPYFDGCLPIEVMAERGRETLRFGPMKPVGLTNPHKPRRAALRRGAAAPGQCAGHAVEHGGLPDQAEARRAGAHLPHDPRAWQSAEFARLGGLHRNTFLNQPKLLDGELRLKASRACASPARSPACEGYVESAAIGLLAGRFAAAERLGRGWLAAAADHGASAR